MPSEITMEVTPWQPQQKFNNASFTKTVFTAGLFYWMLLDCTVTHCIVFTICKYVISFPERSVWRQAWCVCVGSLSGERVSPPGRAGPVRHLLLEAQSLLSAERWQEGPGLPGRFASASFIPLTRLVLRLQMQMQMPHWIVFCLPTTISHTNNLKCITPDLSQLQNVHLICTYLSLLQSFRTIATCHISVTVSLCFPQFEVWLFDLCPLLLRWSNGRSEAPQTVYPMELNF